MDVTKILNEFEVFEFSNVENPANAPSVFTEINYLAKSVNSKSEEILKQTNILYNSLKCKKAHSFKYMELLNKLMPLEPPQQQTPDPNGADNSMEARLAALEEAVGRILEMLQSNVTEMKSKEDDDKKDDDDKDKKKTDDEDEKGEEKKKEEDVSQKKILPKDPTEKIQDSPPASNAADDKVKIVEKELAEIKKTLAGQSKVMDELSEIKKLLESNKNTTPKPMDDSAGTEIKKGAVVRPKNFADANRMMRARK